MPYSAKLKEFASWYKQLLGESIGKTPKIGITPVSALGVTDQHSQTQLFNDGPKDKLIMFLEVKNLGPALKIPGSKTFNRLMSVEKQATEMAYTEKGQANLTIRINKISEQSLGELFMLFEASIAFLGEYFKINAFDQPGVERSKILTKQLL